MICPACHQPVPVQATAKHTITPKDIGKRWLEIGGRNHSLVSSIGYIQAGDIGKVLYLRNNLISMSRSTA